MPYPEWASHGLFFHNPFTGAPLSPNYLPITLLHPKKSGRLRAHSFPLILDSIQGLSGLTVPGSPHAESGSTASSRIPSPAFCTAVVHHRKPGDDWYHLPFILRWRHFGHLYHRRHKANHLRHLVPSLCYRPLRPSHRQDNTQREVQDHAPTGFTIMAPSR